MKVKLFRKLRNQLVKFCKRLVMLSMEGPFYRLLIWCGRRCSCGRISARCQPPHSLRLKATGWNEVCVTWATRKPMNPFHEERYIISWRRIAEPSNGNENEENGITWPWTEKCVEFKTDCEEIAGGRLRIFLGDLLEHTRIEARICAANVYGRTEWTELQSAQTLQRPCEDGGSTGPLGLAGRGGQYTWTQSQNHIMIKVPIGATRGRDIRFKAYPSRIEVRDVSVAADSGVATGSDELLVGPFPKKIKADDVTWDIEESSEGDRYISAQFEKAEGMEKWPCLIEGAGHPIIDTRLAKLFTKGLDGMGMGGGMPGGIDIFE